MAAARPDRVRSLSPRLQLSPDARPQRHLHRYYYCRGQTCCGPATRAAAPSATSAPMSSTIRLRASPPSAARPAALIAAERAVIAGAPVDENELVAASSTARQRARGSELERSRLLDAYQAGLLELDELTRRTAVTTRREQLADREEHAHRPHRRARDREPPPPRARRLRRARRRVPRRTRPRRPPATDATRCREGPRDRLAGRDPPQDPATPTTDPTTTTTIRPDLETRTVKRYAPAFPSCSSKAKATASRERGTAPASAARPALARKVTPSARPRRRHLTPLAYGSLREKPPHHPSSGPGSRPPLVEHFSVPETGALFGSC